MISFPESALADLAMVAVRQQSPEASLLPLLVRTRLRKATHRVYDHNISLGLEDDSVAIAVEVALELQPAGELQEIHSAFLKYRLH